MARYLEFATASNFSFLRGASNPEELMVQAAHVGLEGLGLCDRNTVAGVVRAYTIRRAHALALRYHPGARLVFADGTPDILAYPRDRAGWGRLCRLLTRGNLRAEKGDCILFLDDLLEFADGLELIVMERCTREGPPAYLSPDVRKDIEVSPRVTSRLAGEVDRAKRGREGGERTEQVEKSKLKTRRERHLLSLLRSGFPGHIRLAAAMLYRGNDRARLAQRGALAREAGVPLIAVNDVLYHHPERRPLADVVTCIREHLQLETAGRRLAANAERYLKPPEEMARLFRDAPEAIAETLRLSDQLAFSLDDLAYDYPDESFAGFATPHEALVRLTWQGAAQRYPDGVPEAVRRSLDNEFALVAARNYAPYFLTVYDIVRYARSQQILCQGRGSAANSTICYCLGITSVDPVESGLLFERFISTEREEPPDIDVDFEHERREEVIQYIYRKYHRDHAGIAATVISYRGRSAVREVGKVFGLSEDVIGALSSSIWGMGGGRARNADLTRIGIDVNSPRVQKMQKLIGEIQSFPRHLSQHVGGFVVTRSRLDEVVPVMNGAMDERTHIEWDKDDLDALKILKVDVLGLGMLTCIRKAFELGETHYGLNFRRPQLIPPPQGEGGSSRSEEPGGDIREIPHPPAFGGHPPREAGRDKTGQAARGAFELSTVPQKDEALYHMLCRADSIGVFQVESRAQMSMLPRLRPTEFYDLVIEVAIVRPGPIQGDMVHPYLRRRLGQESVDYVRPELEAVLKKTLGVPLFQEQAMKIAIVAGGFTPGEADKLRRAMATFKRTGTIGAFHDKMVEGMVAKGYPRDFAERCFSQIEGFGEYGFPESHAASFALLVYASAWLKCHYPDVFTAALLNSQPMGFYASAQIVRDAREHGVEVKPPDVNFSDYDSTLEEGPRAAEHLHPRHADMRGDILTTHAVRLGLREVKGLSEDDARQIMAMRSPRVTSPLEGEVDQCRRAGIDREGGELSALSFVRTPLPNPPPAKGRSRPSLTGYGGRGQTAPVAMSVSNMQPYTSVRDLWLRTGLEPRVIERLADADAFGSLGLTRRQALWAVKALGRVGDKDDDLPLFAASSSACAGAHPPPLRGRVGEGGRQQETYVTPLPLNAGKPTLSDLPLKGGGKKEGKGRERAPAQVEKGEPHVQLPPMSLGEEVVNDYRFLKLSLRAHPASFLRADMTARGIVANDTLRQRRSGERLTVSGLVTCRQRPGSAQGVVFLTIEDETSLANIIIWPKMFEHFRPIVLGARYVAVSGVLQQESDVIHVVAERLVDLTPLLARLAEGPAVESLARCDEVRRPGQDAREQIGKSRHRRLMPLLDQMPDLISDLDVPARGSAHAPNRRAR